MRPVPSKVPLPRVMPVATTVSAVSSTWAASSATGSPHRVVVTLWSHGRQCPPRSRIAATGSTVPMRATVSPSSTSSRSATAASRAAARTSGDPAGSSTGSARGSRACGATEARWASSAATRSGKGASSRRSVSRAPEKVRQMPGSICPSSKAHAPRAALTRTTTWRVTDVLVPPARRVPCWSQKTLVATVSAASARARSKRIRSSLIPHHAPGSGTGGSERPRRPSRGCGGPRSSARCPRRGRRSGQVGGVGDHDEDPTARCEEWSAGAVGRRIR